MSQQNMSPPPKKKRSRVGSFFSHRCLVPPKHFPQRKSGFCSTFTSERTKTWFYVITTQTQFQQC